MDVPNADIVDRFLPAYTPKAPLSFDDPRTFGGFVPTDYYYEQRYSMQHDALDALTQYPKICLEFNRFFDREYDLVEEYHTRDADIILVTAGTITSVARITVNEMRQNGQKVGLMKLRMFRPVPAERWRQVLKKAKKVVIIDRNMSMGLGGVFANEVKASLYPLDPRPKLYPVIAGLGGRDVTPDDVDGILKHVLLNDQPPDETLYWGLKQ